MFLAQYDSSGSQQMLSQFGTKGHDFLPVVAVGSNGQVYISGPSDGSFLGHSKTFGKYDTVVASLDFSSSATCPVPWPDGATFSFFSNGGRNIMLALRRGGIITSDDLCFTCKRGQYPALDGLQCITCPDPEYCPWGILGGATADEIDEYVCLEGHEGYGCAQCSDNYFRLQGRCQKCPKIKVRSCFLP